MQFGAGDWDAPFPVSCFMNLFCSFYLFSTFFSGCLQFGQSADVNL